MRNELKLIAAILLLLLIEGPSSARPNEGLMPGAETAIVLIGPSCKCKKPLHRAVWAKNIEEVELIVSSGADLNEYESPQNGDPCHLTPLHLAIYSKSLAAVNLLLDHGAKVNLAAGPIYDTPLAIAIAIRNPDIIRTLVNHGAPVSGIQHMGFFTPLQESIIVEHLDNNRDVKAGRPPKSFLVPLLIELGAEVNEREIRFDRTALHVAVELRQIETVRLLLSLGAFPNGKDGRNQTPLAIAKQRGYKEIMELLISQGAKMSISKEIGNSCTSSDKLMQCTCTDDCLSAENRCWCSGDH